MRQLDSQNDFYTRKAKEEGYVARSIYKLQEIDERFRVFSQGDKVLDLGCAPGSWLQYLSNKVGDNGKIVGVDTEELKILLPKNAFFVKKDILADDFFSLDCLKEQYNAVISDLAPHTSGIKDKDVAESLELGQMALEIAKKVLLEDSWFICKIFEGLGVDDFFQEVKKNFEKVKRFKPKAIKRGSREFYIVGKGFK